METSKLRFLDPEKYESLVELGLVLEKKPTAYWIINTITPDGDQDPNKLLPPFLSFEETTKKLPGSYMFKVVPALTLGDIIDLLPSEIPEPAKDGYVAGTSSLEMSKTSVWYVSWHLDDKKIKYIDTGILLLSAYHMLKWVLENKLI